MQDAHDAFAHHRATTFAAYGDGDGDDDGNDTIVVTAPPSGGGGGFGGGGGGGSPDTIVVTANKFAASHMDGDIDLNNSDNLAWYTHLHNFLVTAYEKAVQNPNEIIQEGQGHSQTASDFLNSTLDHTYAHLDNVSPDGHDASTQHSSGTYSSDTDIEINFTPTLLDADGHEYVEGSQDTGMDWVIAHEYGHASRAGLDAANQDVANHTFTAEAVANTVGAGITSWLGISYPSNSFLNTYPHGGTVGS